MFRLLEVDLATKYVAVIPTALLGLGNAATTDVRRQLLLYVPLEYCSGSHNSTIYL
jgi:hypothetical protein